MSAPDVRDVLVRAAGLLSAVAVYFTRDGHSCVATGRPTVVDARSVRIETYAGAQYLIPIATITRVEILPRGPHRPQPEDDEP